MARLNHQTLLAKFILFFFSNLPFCRAAPQIRFPSDFEESLHRPHFLLVSHLPSLVLHTLGTARPPFGSLCSAEPPHFAQRKLKYWKESASTEPSHFPMRNEGFGHFI